MGATHEEIGSAELANNVDIKTGEQITDLSVMPESTTDAILKAEDVRKHLLEKSEAVGGVNKEKLLELAEGIEFQESQLEILSQALIEACKELPPEIENAGKDLKTTYEYGTSEVDSARLENLNANKRRGLYFTLSLLKRTCKYPYILMGSIPHIVIVGEN
ncbi:MAG: hypothetical protein KGZ37_00390, partial [Nitrosarchaeum sp.]|nr:hypothetical protein [Nitrosarchaeum sp.]